MWASLLLLSYLLEMIDIIVDWLNQTLWILLLFSHSVVSNSLRTHWLQHARLPCPSLTSRNLFKVWLLSWWCHPTISSSVASFSSCSQSFSASESFPMSQLFASGGQSLGASALVLPMNSQGWFPLGLTGLISLQSKGLSRVFSNTSVWKASLLWHSGVSMVQLSYPYVTTGKTISSVQSLSRVQLFATHGLQHARLPCPLPSPKADSSYCPLSLWCHPTISSSVVPFASCLQSFPASGSLPMSHFFASDGQSIGVSASASLLPMNIQDWFPLGWTGWISLQSKGLSRVFSNTTVQKHQFFSAQRS